MSLNSITTEVRTTGSDTLCSGAFETGGSGIDYTQQDAAQFNGTNLTVDATTNTDVTPDGHTVVSTDLNNTVYIPTGGAWTPGTYAIRSLPGGGKWRLDRSPAAVGTSGGTWYVGGACATPGRAVSITNDQGTSLKNDIFLKSGTYTYTTGTANVAGGVCQGIANKTWSIFGYDTTRTKTNTDSNRPTIAVPGAGVSSVTLIGGSTNNADGRYHNFILDGNSKTSIKGIEANGTRSSAYRVKVMNCTNGAIGLGQPGQMAVSCEITGCSTTLCCTGGTFRSCYAHDNTITAFSACNAIRCIADTNTGASSDGFVGDGFGTYFFDSCSAYGNGRDGFRLTGGRTTVINCIAVGNTGVGFNGAADQYANTCATYNNTGGAFDATTIQLGSVTLSADPFTDSANGDFSLNNTAGGGAALRAAGYDTIPTQTVGALDVGALQHLVVLITTLLNAFPYAGVWPFNRRH